MKSFKKFVCLLLIAISLMEPSTVAIAESSSNNQNTKINEMDPRLKNSSFGSQDRPDQKQELERKSTEMNISPLGGGVGLFYQVHILGEVANPGTYRVTASTRLSEALNLAGGIMERGSQRRIQLRRRDGGGRSVDLVSFKILGSLDQNPFLLDNDVIFVPLTGKVVQIAGAVKRPGSYELIKERNIADLLKVAGGFESGVSEHTPIKVIRYVGGKKNLIDVENDPSALRGFELAGADVVVVPHVLTEDTQFDYNVARLPGDNPLFLPSYEERVFVLGAVENAGPYAFSPYYNIRQYLTLAGGTTKLAKLKKIRVITVDGKTIKAANNTKVNPGDTIVVPEKYMSPENVVSLVLGITTSILGITTTILTLTR